MKIKYKIKAILCLCAVAFMISSCKKVIDLQLADSASQLVIEGNVTDVSGAQVLTISKSVNFSDSNTFPPVAGAVVKMTDTYNRVYNFTERTPGTYTVNTTGHYGETYTLQVQVNGQTYKAKSTMPIGRVKMDSISMDAQTFGNSDTKTVAVYYHDPSFTKNQYRFVLTVNGVEVRRVLVKNDQFNDGRSIQVLLYQDDITINTGDKIDVEMQCIDPAIYNYWYTFSQQQNGPGSATPSNPTNNFDNNVLGYFSAHTTQHLSLLVK